jgi:hypothetical protein
MSTSSAAGSGTKNAFRAFVRRLRVGDLLRTLIPDCLGSDDSVAAASKPLRHCSQRYRRALCGRGLAPGAGSTRPTPHSLGG